MTGPYNWSPAMAAIRKAHVLDPVHADPRTDREENLLLGHPLSLIRTSVLEWGLTDFRQPADLSGRPPLTPGEKVLLYCYVNMRKQFFACSAAYAEYDAVIGGILGSATPPLVIDVGCGPATAVLALADRYPGRRMAYLGIDLAPAMLEKAKSLWDAARAGGVVGAGSTATFQPSWVGLNVSALAPETPVLVLCSYFFAARTLGAEAVRSLVQFVRALAAGRATEPTVVFVDSSQARSGANYQVFARGLGFDPEAFPPVPMTIEYRTLGGEPSGKEEFVYDLFHVLGD